MKIQGIEGIAPDQVQFEIQQGGKFVLYYYTVSVVFMTFRRSSDIYFLRHGESAVTKGLGWTFLTFLAGWWGIPWGPIYTVQSLYVNLRGGKDVTTECISALGTGTPAVATAGA